MISADVYFAPVGSNDWQHLGRADSISMEGGVITRRVFISLQPSEPPRTEEDQALDVALTEPGAAEW